MPRARMLAGLQGRQIAGLLEAGLQADSKQAAVKPQAGHGQTANRQLAVRRESKIRGVPATVAGAEDPAL